MHKSLMFMAVLFLFASCKKEQDCPKPTGIRGEWEWVQSTGGFGGWKLTPESEGYRIRLVIDNFMYREYKNDSLIFEAQYDLMVRPDTFFNTNNYISFESGGEKAIVIGTEELLLYDLCADCFDHVYRRR